MNTKLTLKLDTEVIERAKHYAASQQRSLSGIVEDYLKLLTEQTKTKDEIEISPFVKSMTSGAKIPADIDYKSAYADYLMKKHR